MEKEGNGEGNREAIAIQLSVTQKPLGKKKKKHSKTKSTKLAENVRGNSTDKEPKAGKRKDTQTTTRNSECLTSNSKE